MSTSEDPSGTSTSPAPAAASTPPRTEDRFPRVDIQGGPHGHNTKFLVDGVQQKAVTRIELIFDVNDAVRMKTFQIAVAKVGAVVKVSAISFAAKVAVQLTSEDGASYEVLAEAEADTIWQALHDCAEQIRLNAESEQTGSTGGTVGGPDSGPEEVVNGQDQAEPAPGEDRGTEGSAEEG